MTETPITKAVLSAENGEFIATIKDHLIINGDITDPDMAVEFGAIIWKERDFLRQMLNAET